MRTEKQSLGQAFSKACGVSGRRPDSRSAERETSFAFQSAGAGEFAPKAQRGRTLAAITIALGFALKEISLRRNFFEKSERTFCRIYATCPREQTSVPLLQKTCAVLFYCYHPKGNTARLRAITKEKYGESVVTVTPPSERARCYVSRIRYCAYAHAFGMGAPLSSLRDTFPSRGRLLCARRWVNTTKIV